LLVVIVAYPSFHEDVDLVPCFNALAFENQSHTVEFETLATTILSGALQLDAECLDLCRWIGTFLPSMTFSGSW